MRKEVIEIDNVASQPSNNNFYKKMLQLVAMETTKIAILTESADIFDFINRGLVRGGLKPKYYPGNKVSGFLYSLFEDEQLNGLYEYTQHSGSLKDIDKNGNSEIIIVDVNTYNNNEEDLTYLKRLNENGSRVILHKFEKLPEAMQVYTDMNLPWFVVTSENANKIYDKMAKLLSLEANV